MGFFFLSYLINDFSTLQLQLGGVKIFLPLCTVTSASDVYGSLVFSEEGREAKASWALLCTALNGLGIAVFCRYFADLFISFMAAHGQEEGERERERRKEEGRKRSGNPGIASFRTSLNHLF